MHIVGRKYYMVIVIVWIIPEIKTVCALWFYLLSQLEKTTGLVTNRSLQRCGAESSKCPILLYCVVQLDWNEHGSMWFSLVGNIFGSSQLISYEKVWLDTKCIIFWNGFDTDRRSLMSEKSSEMQYLRNYAWEETEHLILTLKVISYELVSNYF